MVVGGLPERNTVHAECVANQALDMMHYCKQVIEPDSDPEEPIKVTFLGISTVLLCWSMCMCVCVLYSWYGHY